MKSRSTKVVLGLINGIYLQCHNSNHIVFAVVSLKLKYKRYPMHLLIVTPLHKAAHVKPQTYKVG